MDADEFLKRVEPAAKRSRLAPFLDDIKKLRGEGCTLDQVREFLAANGVTISVAGLSKFLKRQEEKPGAGQAATSAASGSATVDCAIQSQSTPGGPQEKKVGDFNIPKPKKFVHNPKPDDGILD